VRFQDQSLTLKRLLGRVRRWLPFILAACIIAASAAFFLTRDRSQSYRATATLLIGIADQQPNRNDAVNAGQGLARTYARIFADPQLYEQAANELALPGVTAELLRSSISVYAVSGTALIDIQVNWWNPQEAILIANHMAEMFVMQRREQSLASLAPFREQTIEQRRAIEAELSQIDPDDYNTPQALGLRKEQEQLIIREQGLLTQAAEIEKQIDIASFASTATQTGIASSQIILIAMAIAATVALSLAILAELLAPTLVLEDVVRRAGLREPIVLPPLESKQAWRELIDNGTSSASLALRLLPGHVPAGAKRLLLAGIGMRTDASSIAINLATVYAEEGRRVLLIDANVDQPQLGERFGFTVANGVQKAIQSTAQIDGAILSTPIPGVSLIGAEANNTSPIDPRGFMNLLDQVEKRFDLVIIDLAEPLRHSLAPRLIQALEGVILVAHPREVTERALKPYTTWVQQKMPDRPAMLVVYKGTPPDEVSEGTPLSTPLMIPQAQSKD
jgi:capsular polysaccharide biosynthesis protein